MNFNRVILAGNLTRDPESREVVVGGLSKAVCSFGLAVNRTRDGVSSTMFIDVEVWARMAEIIRDHFRKGQPIFLEGYLKLDQWESQGARRSKHKVVMQSFQFVGPKGETGPVVRDTDGGGQVTAIEVDEDDIPF